jgi:hypothetical protein
MNTNIGVLLLGLETTEGTDPTLVAANAVLPLEPIMPDYDFAFKHPRDKLVVGAAIQASPPLTPKGLMATRQNTFHLRGTKDGLKYQASDLPELDALFQSAGFAQTLTTTSGTEKVVYTPAATALKSHAEYWYSDGRLYKVLAAKSDLDFAFDAGGPVMVTAKRTGLSGGITDVALISSPVFGAALPPIAENVGLSITPSGGSAFAAGIIRKWSNNTGNQIKQRANANVTGGLSPHKIRERKFAWSVVLETELAATIDWEGIRAAKTGCALTFAFGPQYGKYHWIAPNCIVEMVKYSDDSGTQITTLSGGCYDSVYGANDAVSHSFE